MKITELSSNLAVKNKALEEERHKNYAALLPELFNCNSISTACAVGYKDIADFIGLFRS